MATTLFDPINSKYLYPNNLPGELGNRLQTFRLAVDDWKLAEQQLPLPGNAVH
jgi:hypothetical protein